MKRKTIYVEGFIDHSWIINLMAAADKGNVIASHTFCWWTYHRVHQGPFSYNQRNITIINHLIEHSWTDQLRPELWFMNKYNIIWYDMIKYDLIWSETEWAHTLFLVREDLLERLGSRPPVRPVRKKNSFFFFFSSSFLLLILLFFLLLFLFLLLLLLSCHPWSPLSPWWLPPRHRACCCCCCKWS